MAYCQTSVGHPSPFLIHQNTANQSDPKKNRYAFQTINYILWNNSVITVIEARVRRYRIRTHRSDALLSRLLFQLFIFEFDYFVTLS